MTADNYTHDPGLAKDGLPTLVEASKGGVKVLASACVFQGRSLCPTSSSDRVRPVLGG